MSKSRPSIAGPPSRPAGLSSSQEAVGTANRRSTTTSNSGWDGRESHANNLPLSGSRGDGGMYGKTPRNGSSMGTGGSMVPPGSVRRSSVYSGSTSGPRPSSVGRQSLAPGAGMPAMMKDPRNIKDAYFQRTSRQAIVDFLRNSNYPYAQIRDIKSPTASDVQNIFKWVYYQLDPDFKFGANGKKFEDECITILKDLGYGVGAAGLGGVSKTMITAPGSNSWPSVCAMLAWMVELATAKHTWLTTPALDPNLDPTAITPAMASELPNLYELWFFDFLCNAYAKWYEGQETFEVEEAELKELFDSKNSLLNDEADEMQSTLAALKLQLDHLQSAKNPLQLLEDEYVNLTSDKGKFESLQAHQQKQITRLKNGNAKMVNEIQVKETELGELAVEKTSLVVQISQQGLSEDEVTKMLNDRQVLQASMDELKINRERSEKLASQKEMLVAKRGDELANLTDTYQSQIYSIGLHPSPPEPFSHINFFIDNPNLATSSLSSIITADIRGTLQPALRQFAEAEREKTKHIEDENIVDEDELDKVNQRVEDLKDEIHALEQTLSLTKNKLEVHKSEYAVEAQELQTQVLKLETEVSNIRQTAQQSVLAAEARVSDLSVEFNDLKFKTEQMRQNVVDEITNHAAFIIQFKTAASDKLEQLREFAARN